MPKDELKMKQIEKCLSCRIGAQVIENYSEIYAMETCEDKLNQKVVEEIAEILELDGTTEEKFKQLKMLSRFQRFEEETDMCLVNLQQIICALRGIFSEAGDETTIDVHPNLTNVLSLMIASNKKTMRHYDEDKAKETLDLFKQPQKREDTNYIHEIAEGIKEIFDDFCRYDKSSYEINSKGECFLKSVDYNHSIWEDESKSNEEYKNYMNRANDLSMEDKEIIHGYIKNAPKKFGNNLKLVMERQGMTEQDIAMLIGVTPSVIQSLEKCEVTVRSKEDIKRLCRALLVSEDVLYNGAGKIYGNWKMLLDKEGIKALQEAEKSLNAHDKKVSAMEMKNFARGKIKELIERDDSEFYQMIKDAPELFCEEDINIYPDEKDGFKNLLHKEEAYTLLKVLEKKN